MTHNNFDSLNNSTLIQSFFLILVPVWWRTTIAFRIDECVRGRRVFQNPFVRAIFLPAMPVDFADGDKSYTQHDETWVVVELVALEP